VQVVQCDQRRARAQLPQPPQGRIEVRTLSRGRTEVLAVTLAETLIRQAGEDLRQQAERQRRLHWIAAHRGDSEPSLPRRPLGVIDEGGLTKARIARDKQRARIAVRRTFKQRGDRGAGLVPLPKQTCLGHGWVPLPRSRPHSLPHTKPQVHGQFRGNPDENAEK
jgi:hypothetical protein